TDYSPSDLATMLQSGGVQLLDVQTLRALRNDESVIRWGLARMARYQKLSDELIVPNLDQNISFFYDPATKKLRKRFEIYPEALQETVNIANDLERTHTELLKQIQAERKQNHYYASNIPNLYTSLVPLGREFRVGRRLSGAD